MQHHTQRLVVSLPHPPHLPVAPPDRPCTQPGTFSTGIGSTECKPCDKGFYSSGFGSTQCRQCPPGYFSDAAGSSVCKAAPKGYFSLGKTAAPTRCAIGTFQNLMAQSGCKPCLAGGYCATPGLVNPVLCGLNTFNPLTGSTSSIACRACPPGAPRTAAPGATSAAQCRA